MSGWILDPDRKKMSKSKGNVVTPIDLFDSYGSDAVRYWAANARPGIDTAFSEEQMKVGRKLATKLLNVTKFVLGFGEADAGAVPTHPLDVAMLARLAAVVDEATGAFENYDYARSLERTESFFWWFCDDYVELVKSRAYATHGEEGAASARAALARALSALQRLLAPILPFVTEEVWSWWQDGSVHRAAWPVATELTVGTTATDSEALIESVCGTLALVRRAKTEAKVSQRAAVARAVVSAQAQVLGSVRAGWADIADAGSVAEVEFVESAGDLDVSVTLAATD
jgi:valyl-tRNA synthetase